MPVKSKKVSAKTTTETEKKIAPKASGLSVPTFSLAGREIGTLILPKAVFGIKINQKLLAQAVRVYATNQKSLLASTKTRGEVAGSTAKIYRQKGTGRARHGSVRAPIFVGGGIVFGPKSRNVKLNLPKKMKKAALISALSFKMLDKNIRGLTGMEKASGKTREMVKLLEKVAGRDKKEIQSVLIVTAQKADNVIRATRNISTVTTLSANAVNAYEVLKHDILLITKEAVEKLVVSPTKEAK